MFDAAAAAAEQQGRGGAAEGLRAERERCVQHYAALSSLATSSACQEDEASGGGGRGAAVAGAHTQSVPGTLGGLQHAAAPPCSPNWPHPPPCMPPAGAVWPRRLSTGLPAAGQAAERRVAARDGRRHADGGAGGRCLGCAGRQRQARLAAQVQPCCVARMHTWQHGQSCLPVAAASTAQRPCAASQPRALPGAGRSLAGRLRDRDAFPTPLFFAWPPGPDATPYLGAAHGLMGEACSSPPLSFILLLSLPPCPRGTAAAGRRQAAAAGPGCPSPLWFVWHDKPYLGAAHGMIGESLCTPCQPCTVPGSNRPGGHPLSRREALPPQDLQRSVPDAAGPRCLCHHRTGPEKPAAPTPSCPAGILFTLLQLPEEVAAIPGAQADVQAALRYVLTLEHDAEGRPGELCSGRCEALVAQRRWRFLGSETKTVRAFRCPNPRLWRLARACCRPGYSRSWICSMPIARAAPLPPRRRPCRPGRALPHPDGALARPRAAGALVPRRDRWRGAGRMQLPPSVVGGLA